MITQIKKIDYTDFSRAGFMLLEVILSVLIIALGLLFVIRSYTTSLRASALARALSKASLVLEEKLFDVDVKGFKDGVEEKEDSAIEGGYSWSLIAQPNDKEEINKIDLKVGWKGHIIHILTFRKYKKG